MSVNEFLEIFKEEIDMVSRFLCQKDNFGSSMPHRLEEDTRSPESH